MSYVTSVTGVLRHLSIVIIVNMLTAGHRTPDTPSDFIFCPMVLCIALDRLKANYSYSKPLNDT